MPKATYSPALRKTDAGRRLYQIWKRMRSQPYDPAWDKFPEFYTWAMDEGYIPGSHLLRDDDSLPYGPENCFWKPLAGADLWELEWCKKWDETVGILRKHFGLPPLKGGES